MDTNKNRLLMVLQSYAYDAAEQQRCSEMLWAAEADHMNEKSLELILASAIVDGLRHGNWPWTIAKSPFRSVRRHIMEAFEGKRPGEFMTTRQIAEFASKEFGDLERPSMGMIVVALKGPKNIPNVKFAMVDGRSGGQATVSEATD